MIFVNFYSLFSEDYSSALTTLLYKSLEVKKNCLVLCKNEDHTCFVDDLLWRSANRWLPHCLLGDELEEHHPIVLSTENNLEEHNYQTANNATYLFLPDISNLKDIGNFKNLEKIFILFPASNDELLFYCRNLWRDMIKFDNYKLSFYQQDKQGRFELKRES